MFCLRTFLVSKLIVFTKTAVNIKSSFMRVKLDRNLITVAEITLKPHKMIYIFPAKKEYENEAAKLLKSDEVIAIPTDTVYGLACSAISSKAIQKLYKIKERDELKPVAICVSSITDFRLYGEADHLSDSLLKDLLPGPVTLVLNKTNRNNSTLNPNTNKVGIRIPESEFACNVVKLAGIPIALTSANVSGQPSTLGVEEFKNLHCKLGGVFDAGKLGCGSQAMRAASTVVDLSVRGSYAIERRGIAFENTIKILQAHGLVEYKAYNAS